MIVCCRVSAGCRASAARAGLSSCGDGRHRRRRCRSSPWAVGGGRSCCGGMKGREPVLGGLGSWVLIVGAWAWEWAWVSGLEPAVWRLAGMEPGVVAVVVGRSWDLEARMGVGVVLGGLDPVGLVEGLSMSAGGIFLLRRCLRASGWPLVAMSMVAEAGMCLRVVCRTTFLMISRVFVITLILFARVRRRGYYVESRTHVSRMSAASPWQ